MTVLQFIFCLWAGYETIDGLVSMVPPRTHKLTSFGAFRWSLSILAALTSFIGCNGLY